MESVREARAQANLLPPGGLKNALLEKARQHEAQISGVTAPMMMRESRR